MMEEGALIEGVLPKFDENGRLKSISMYAQESFLAPKTSLIGAARKKAELKAKRDFVSFIKEKVKGKTLTEYLLEQREKTTESGETSGSAEEITRVSDYIGQETESVLSGIVKLDECVDIDMKMVLVRMGWKPQISQAAADARQTIDREIKRGESGGSSSSVGTREIKPASGYRKKSPLADDF
ncbi:hypothetical protein C2E25_17150 [Geothermobacter hydrogeniphilus]|uniref:Uncharacterized protein n=2 Tax=Geothermobacter hydrogeniphilus TaxID=1969733 RepID=A0A2K2H5B9_9BACT|nr:hypothetical protein C2E25_17150 [Geothermobacter hydrogeniphilus]